MIKKCILLFLCLFSVVTLICFLNINTKAINEDNSFLQDAKSGCLIECKTGKIIYGKNENDRLAPASMTKIMTMILVMEKIYNGDINYSDMVITLKEAASLGGSQIYLCEGEKMSVHDLLKAMCIASANDAAMSLGIYVGGTEKLFVNKMNEKAKEIGLENTNFINPYGFDDPNHYSSSYDMAKMASYLINNYPDILKYTCIYEDYVREDTEKRFWLVNTNKLVKFVDGVDGLKTGWTNNSGYCLTATITKKGERFIAVAMGSSSPTIRNKEITELLQYGINNYETVQLVKKGEIIDEIKDISVSPKHIILKATDDVIIIKKKTDKLKNYNINKVINLDNQEFYIDVFYDDMLYSRILLDPQTKIKQSNIFELLYEVIKELFLGSN